MTHRVQQSAKWSKRNGNKQYDMQHKGTQHSFSDKEHEGLRRRRQQLHRLQATSLPSDRFGDERGNDVEANIGGANDIEASLMYTTHIIDPFSTRENRDRVIHA